MTRSTGVGRGVGGGRPARRLPEHLAAEMTRLTFKAARRGNVSAMIRLCVLLRLGRAAK